MGLNNESERMAGSVQRKGSQYLNFEIALRPNLPLHLLWRKSNLRILGAFQDVFVHLVIARLTVGVAAGGVNDHQSTGMPRDRVKLYRSTLQFERPMNGVQNITQS